MATAPVANSTIPRAVASYLVYGWEGVTRVVGDQSTRLVAEPVSQAFEDGAGGIIFRSVAARPGWAWLQANAARPASIVVTNDGRIAGLFSVNGRPSALVSRGFDKMTRCQPHDYHEELMIHDLETGDERFFMCHGQGPDGGESFTSFGGGLFSCVRWAAAGAGGTNTSLLFYGLDGEHVAAEHNPFVESCAPCRLSARLSPEGALLAYARWPTAYWQQPEPSDGDHNRAYREWYAQQQHIPTKVVVIETATGAEVFRTEVSANATVTEFDGRIVTVTTEDGRQLHDIATGDVLEAPPAMSEPAAFWTGVLASPATAAMDYDAAQEVAADLADRFGVETGVLWSDGFITLNAGFWAIFAGHFPTRNDALEHCETLDTDCYPRYVATADTIDPQTGRDMLKLESDGLGLVRFGDLEDDVLALMERLIGSRPTDSSDAADWVEYVGWEDIGLYLGFSRPMWEDYDGISRLVGWQYRGEVDEPDLETAHRVRVGTTTAQLRVIFGDALIVHTDPDECSGVSVRLLGRDEGIVALLDGAGVVRALVAGLGVGC